MALALLAGCTGAVEPEDTSQDTEEPIVPISENCDPPLTVTPASGSVPPYQLLSFRASGGTGEYRFTLADPSSGDIHPTAGTYGASGEVGATDTVLVTDAGCEGEVTASVTVVDAMTLVPAAATVPPGTAIAFEVSGALGDATCAFIANDSGGTLGPDCAYVAGSVEGTDILEVTDEAGFSAQADVEVRADASIDPEGYAHWVLPLGANFRPSVSGGSGVFEYVVLDGDVGIAGEALSADVVGRSTVEVIDAFVGTSFEVTVDVVPPLVPDREWQGSRQQDTRVAAAGDLDGDGFDDAVVAIRELNATRWRGGAVFVYRGSATGLLPTPAQVFAGEQRDQAFGTDVVLADVNNDGQQDLIVGAQREDFAGDDIGSVRVYPGVSGGLFEEDPAHVLHGVNSFDRAGASVDACDLNGDGYVDILMGADGAEDRNPVNFPTATGALYVFAGGPGGFVDEPVTARYGVRLDTAGSGWETASGIGLGRRDIAVGDTNADGRCDVAVSVSTYRIDAAVGGIGEGYVLVYEGVESTYLTEEPVRAYANLIDTSAQFGRRLAMADFDQDGRDDLAIGSQNYSAAQSSSGGVFVYLSTDDDGRAATAPYTSEQASWFATGPSSDNLGKGLHAADVDGDGIPDLIAGAQSEDESFTNAGQVRVWSGTEVGASPEGDRFDQAFLTWDGDEGDARLGESVAAVGDTDGDGRVDLVAVASEHDFYGPDVGLPFVWSAGQASALEIVGSAGGERYGFALAWHDGNGDGLADLWGGQPQAANASDGSNAGAATAHLAVAGGFDEASVELPVPSIMTSEDRFGETLTGRSDFDGDGLSDLAVGARQVPSPNAWDASWDNSDGCATGRNGAGAVFLYRGRSGAPSIDPSFVWSTPAPVNNIETLVGGFDHNGDGFDDLLVGDPDWSAGGGYTFVFGRAAGSTTTVLCQDPLYLEPESGADLGHAAAALGDLDGDGCDEVAISAVDADLGNDERGVVHILWGHGGTGCPGGPSRTSIAPSANNVEAGAALAGGGDVDGDGIHDLLVGSVRLDGNSGGVWRVSGAYLTSLPRESFSAGTFPPTTTVHDLSPPGEANLLAGTRGAAGIGSALALVPDPFAPGRSAVAIGAPLGQLGGVPLAGGVRVYRWDTAGDTWESQPFAVFGGESHLPGGQLGSGMVSGAAGLAVGAQWSSQGGPDRGALYVMPAL